MPECLDILIGEQFGELVAPVDRQHRCDGVEFPGTALDGVLRFDALATRAPYRWFGPPFSPSLGTVYTCQSSRITGS